LKLSYSYLSKIFSDITLFEGSSGNKNWSTQK
jgi:hypothetical protein